MPRSLLLCTASLLLLATTATSQEPQEGGRWGQEMEAFSEADRREPTPPGGVVFVGSSSIRLWNLEKSFPEMEPAPLNRGFGGSEVEDSLKHVELLVLRHKPRLVVVYAGDNDIAGGKSPQRVANDFAQLTKRITKALPETRIVYIAIKPSFARWNLADKMHEANRLIHQQCADHKQLTMVDVWKPMLGEDGKPRAELFVKDGLHLSPKGYELWTSLLKPVLQPEPSEDANTETEQ